MSVLPSSVLEQSGRTLRAGCKVNLYLEIVDRRPDGYHELRSLFLPLTDPADELVVAPAAKGTGLRLSCSDPALDTGSNILCKTYETYAEETSFAPDISVRLNKHIPTGAGLGGGSSDAACLLLLLNDLAGERVLSTTELARLATRLGADVPFFLDNQPAWAEGIGERLVPARIDLRGLTLLLVCPATHVATAWAYRAWDDSLPDAKTDRTVLTSLCSGDKKIFCPDAVLLYNSFERVVYATFPHLGRLKEDLLRHGAAGAVMSGSGASLCALFRGRGPAEAAARAVRGSGASCFVHNF